MKSQKVKNIKLTAHDKILIFDNLRYLLEGLEEYVEKSGYYPDFGSKRQLRNITIPKERSENLTVDEAEKFFKTNLILFVSIMDEAPEHIRKGELRDEFYKWISIMGIDVNNCFDEKLKHFLVEIDNVLEGNSEKIIQQTQEYLDNKDKGNLYPTNRQDTLALFGAIQSPMRKERERARNYEGKTYRDIEVEKFDASSNQGKEAFGRIARTVVNKHKDFYFYPQLKEQQKTQPQSNWWQDYRGQVSGSSSQLDNPQQRTNSEIIQDVIKHKNQAWRIDEVITGYDINVVKKEEALIHHSAQVGLDGEVFGSLNSQPVYLLTQRFGKGEIADIKQFLGISQTSINVTPVRWELVNSIKQNAKLERGLFVINQETNEVSENEDWFIHNSLERKIDDKTGYLILAPSAMIRVKDLSEEEQKAINYSCASQQFITSQENKRSRGGKGGGLDNPYIWGFLTIISLIGLAFVR